VFFALPLEEKEKIAWAARPEAGRGYQRLGENVTQGGRDWHEAIDFFASLEEPQIGLDTFSRPPASLQADQLAMLRAFALGQNRWPSQPAKFQASFEQHFSRAADVGRALMQAMGDAFGLRPGFFDSLTDRSYWCARIIGYPPLQDAPSGGNVGLSCGEHTDYGCWTLLAQDSTAGALEVQGANSQSWVTVEPVEGAFVVNLGDMLSVWTQRRFVATPHRVRQTRRDRYRTSIAFFFEPNFDAVIDPAAIPALGDRSIARSGESSLGSTPPLRRALEGGRMLYGEHLYAKVSSNLKPL